MYLLYCSACGDVLALKEESRSCDCGKSAGRIQKEHAQIKQGPGILLALDEEKLATIKRHAFKNQVSRGLCYPV